MTDATTQSELDDIKSQFYAIMENYPTVYANFKANPSLPTARDAHDKADAALTSLHRRMFTFQSALERALDENETTVGDLTVAGARLNAKVARRTAILNNKNAIMESPNVVESFVTRQLPGCTLGADSKPTNCPCVEAGASTCSATCGSSCPATAIQLSLVAEVRDIEKRQYIYAIFRIVYLVVGIAMVSYFVAQTVGSPDSTIIDDAKNKAEQLKQNIASYGGGEQMATQTTQGERK
jgi:hypothetical protein